jgi:hypothetical protein
MKEKNTSTHKNIFIGGSLKKEEMVFFVKKLSKDLGAQKYRVVSYPASTPSSYYTTTMKTISASDVCVFEISELTFAVGCEIMHALDNRRPVIVVRSGTSSRKDFFLEHSGSGLLTVVYYKNEKDMKEKTLHIIKKQTQQKKARVTLYLEQPLYQRIVEKTKGGTISKTAVIEKMIQTWKDAQTA